ncbi:PAS domain-containing sensor histidine kinase [Nemorincola caseinilytica]|uniref:histidine kinase n=1 Tax=Nemorincola caseinilytica TaxID=2054315 RepID=A0ABP8NFK4_9BACT
MTSGTSDPIQNIVDILLHVGERIVEVSRGQVMTRIWDREGSPLAAYRSYYEGKRLDEVRNDSTIAQCRSSVEEAFATGRNSYTEYISYSNDNNKVVAYSLRVLACHPDKENYVFLVIDNISTGKENLLIEDKWKMALDASDQGVWDANMAARTIFFSEKWERLFGYSAKEIVDLDEWAALIYPDDVTVAQQRVQDYLDGKTPIYSAEVRYRCKDGSYKWILSRGVVVDRRADGVPVRFIGTHTDISEQKEVEEELRHTKETFANSFNYSGIPKAIIAPGGTWVEVNDALCKVTGYTREDLELLDYRDITFPDDVDIDVPYIQQLVTREIPSYTLEKRFVTKTRNVLTTIVNVSLVWNKDDTPKYFVCDIMDMSDKKALSDELNRRNAQLEATTVSLKHKIDQLEELNHMIAHNLRGPVGNIKMLSEGGSDIFPDKEALEMIHISSESLLDSLDTMMEVARIRLEKDIEYDNCDVAEIVHSICDQMRGIIYQNHVEVVLDLEVPTIRYPRAYLESILYNLISNSIKYRREDVRPCIRVSTHAENGVVQLSVKDNGLGIDMDRYANRVFKLNQVFHPGHDSKGIGLFITKTRIESLGGSIIVRSKLMKGCEFVITL